MSDELIFHLLNCQYHDLRDLLLESRLSDDLKQSFRRELDSMFFDLERCYKREVLKYGI